MDGYNKHTFYLTYEKIGRERYVVHVRRIISDSPYDVVFTDKTELDEFCRILRRFRVKPRDTAIYKAIGTVCNIAKISPHRKLAIIDQIVKEYA